MRFLVEACFDTAAPRLVLSPTPGEDSVVLVAERCRVELRLRTREATSNLHCDGVPMLEAQPWDTSLLRLRVNGISYGTGPLLLRERDHLTLQARSTAASGTAQEHTYSITRLPDAPTPSPPLSSEQLEGDAQCSPAASAAAPCEDAQRLRTVAANMAEYAKWNNFYNDRFGGGAATPAALPNAGRLPCFHTCTCGYSLPNCAEALRPDQCVCAPGFVPGPAPDAAEAAEATRVLVTLFPSIPSLLASSAEQERKHSEGVEPTVVSCCVCPFAHSRAGGSVRPCNTTRTQNGSDEELIKKAISPFSSNPSPWLSYATARGKDFDKRTSASPVHVSEERGGVFWGESFDRPSAELLSRVAAVESALMGCRYE